MATSTKIKYSKKQITAMIEMYTLEQLRPHTFEDLPVKFKYEISQYGDSVSCHLRTTQGILLKKSELFEWFEKLPDSEQAAVLQM